MRCASVRRKLRLFVHMIREALSPCTYTVEPATRRLHKGTCALRLLLTDLLDVHGTMTSLPRVHNATSANVLVPAQKVLESTGIESGASPCAICPYGLRPDMTSSPSFKSRLHKA